MRVLRNIPIEDIRHRADARHRGDEALAKLADSIEQMGLLSPICIREVDGGFEVVAGSHRLQACELLGWREISAFIMTLDDLHAELAMIDENLVRAELSPLDRAQATTRRKTITRTCTPKRSTART